MFIGHFALGFAAKHVTPRLSLGVLCAATQVADLMWPVLVALGFEHVRIDPGNTMVTPLDFVSYPYSHSLLLLVVWGALFAAVAVWLQPTYVGSGFGRTFSVLFLLVVSHWLLDWITHRPDMPLYPGGPKFGLGLWNSMAGTLAIEMAMYGVGLWLYIGATRPRDAIGRWGFWTLVVFLLAVYLASVFGPPPPSVGAIWATGIAGGAILVAWLSWVDRHRDGILTNR
jgi:hypothetical protein